jgi:hypothetical protein
MRGVIRVAFLVVLAWLTVTSPASASTAATPRRLGAFRALPAEIVTTVATDGERFAVAGLADGATRILDTRRGTSRDVATPPCVNPMMPMGQVGRPLVLVGGGYVAWQCQTGVEGSQLIWMQDLRTNTRFIAAGIPSFWQDEIYHDLSADGSAFTLISVGRHWLYAIRTGYHYTQDALIGISTPRTIFAAADNNPRDVVAPDRAHGTRPLCRDINRPAAINEPPTEDIAHEPLLFDRPFAIDPYNHQAHPIQACANTPAPPSREPVSFAQLGGQLLTWAQGSTIYVRTYASRATASHTFKATDVSVTHTRNRVFAAGYVATIRR